MPTTNLNPPPRAPSASELRRLPPDQRDAVLVAAAEAAEADYRNDRDLTAFKAFGEEDE